MTVRLIIRQAQDDKDKLSMTTLLKTIFEASYRREIQYFKLV